MTPSCDRAFHILHTCLLRVASFLISPSQRAEWRCEWQAELWHVRDSLWTAGGFSWPAQRKITAFCLGSFQDALCVRREFSLVPASPPPLDSSAGQCVLRLATILTVCIIIAHLLPGVQAERDPSRFRVNPGLILIQTAPSTENPLPTIPLSLFRDWKAARQRYFDDFAFYRTDRESASLSGHISGWRVSHASRNLFTLLGLRVQFTNPAGEPDRDLPAVVLSHQAWARDFGADPEIAGRLIRVGRERARIAGVLPAGSWRLPGHPDAWLLESDSRLDGERSSPPLGYLIAHLTPLGQYTMSGESTSVAARGLDDLDLELYAVSFGNRLHGPLGLYEFALILALLALPAVTSVTLGESNYSSHRPSWKRTLYRWAFLAAKFALVAAIGYFASLDIAYCRTSTYSPPAECLQLIACFSVCLFGFRWAMSDQRQRCPVCLRRVTHPAQVGIASRTFLGWNGTEMMCMGGHTLLHVPSLPTSWFSGQRWLYLDTSWEFLFADSGVW